MKSYRSTIFFAALAAALAANGCSTATDEPAAFENRAPKPIIDRDPVTGTADFYMPEDPTQVLKPGADAAQTALDWIDAKKGELGVPSARDAYTPVESSKDDGDGMTHVRLQQKAAGIEVWGIETVLTFNEDGSVAFYDGAYIPNLEQIAKTTPTIDENTARGIAENDAKAQYPENMSATQRTSDLIVYVDDEYTNARLARHVVAEVVRPDGPVTYHSFVDALTGAVLDNYADEGEVLEQRQATAEGFDRQNHTTPVVHDSASNVFTMGRLGTATRGFLASGRWKGKEWNSFTSNTLDGPWDRHAVSATHNVIRSERYYEDEFHWTGPDNKGANIWIVVRDPNDRWNAFGGWGDGEGILTFTPSMDGQRSAVMAVDIVGHEYTHLVTAKTSKLVYRRQPGAINEAVSDIFGELIERKIFGVTEASLVIASATGVTIRNMRHPNTIEGREYPAHYKDVRSLEKGEKPHTKKNDSGYVHSNSSIVNNAAALMIVGGVNDTSQIGVVKPIGWDQSQKLWWKTQRHLLTKRTLIRRLARVQVAAAQKSKHAFLPATVACAWVAVGGVPAAWVSNNWNITCPGVNFVPDDNNDFHDWCKGKVDGTYCAATIASLGYVCLNAKAVVFLECADSAAKCTGVSPDGESLVCTR